MHDEGTLSPGYCKDTSQTLVAKVWLLLTESSRVNGSPSGVTGEDTRLQLQA